MDRSDDLVARKIPGGAWIVKSGNEIVDYFWSEERAKEYAVLVRARTLGQDVKVERVPKTQRG